MRPSLTLFHLYPRLLNLYGDRGNILTLRQRCAWRGIELLVREIGLGEGFPDSDPDIIFMGGDQDREQAVVVEDLGRSMGAALRVCLDAGVPMLAVCGSFQLLQRFYRPARGPDLEGVGLIDAFTVHPGEEVRRCVGNVVVEWDEGSIVGFENHGGRTYLEGDTGPLGRVVKGYGNNGKDGTEGARVGNLFGTYVHGSLLPKNPQFADMLLRLALARRYPDDRLQPLDDQLELRAHSVAIARAQSGN